MSERTPSGNHGKRWDKNTVAQCYHVSLLDDEPHLLYNPTFYDTFWEGY